MTSAKKWNFPNLSFTYDAIDARLSQMTDGTGSTSYTYHPMDSMPLGARKLHTIAFTYDALGRP
jgi:hypothetical protein